MPTEDAAPPETVKEDPFAGVERPEPRVLVVGASVNGDEKTAILRALASGGFSNQSEGARVVLMGYTKSAEVRDAVAAAVTRHEIE